jgi:hypothetical protein
MMLHGWEWLDMVNAIISFFSSFNPIVFCFILACGALIVFRRRSSPVPLRATEHSRSGSNATWRRSH